MTRPRRRPLTVVPVDPEAFKARYLLVMNDEPELTLGELLRDLPALSVEPLDPALLGWKVTSFKINMVPASAGTALYLPPGMTPRDIAAAGTANSAADGTVDGAAHEAADRAADGANGGAPEPADAARTAAETAETDETGETGQTGAEAAPGPAVHPAKLGEREAVLRAHAAEINQAASYLGAGLSVLVRCEKLLVEHLVKEIVARSGRASQETADDTDRPAKPKRTGDKADDASQEKTTDRLGMLTGRRTDPMTALQQAIAKAGKGDVIVVPHLDLLAGGTDASLNNESRELTDLLYRHSGRILLAFIDPSLTVPEVLANRFAIRLAMDILPREVRTDDGARVPIGQALVTAKEAGLYPDFDAVTLYKHIAGMNAVRLRHGLQFAHHRHTQRRRADNAWQPMFADLLQELRVFKANTSTAFEVPNVPLREIGGYGEVKAELKRALRIISGAATAEHGLPEKLRHELVPRGFIFHGPPGTGKTLFAKAIASQLAATIKVVSGPEIMDMYVGESERKLRDLFAEARRNAPSVLVFDEFDSIAGRRTGRDDGGSRAGNAVVAQLLTELDGFRPQVPVLIIGTTNRIDIVDDALLRPSRFRAIQIDLPDEQARRAIAAVHAKHFGVEVGDGVLDAIARVTDRMNGDEIRSIFRDARADELAGGHRRPDARRLGELIGALLLAQQQRQVEKAEHFGGARTARDRARTTFVSLTGPGTSRTTGPHTTGPHTTGPRATEGDDDAP